ncbi:MAG: DUF362 domain-containing protein [Planctomycetes bacterium]|nr:DUF362 domain-containing protein [Planctomycetota bacterium]
MSSWCLSRREFLRVTAGVSAGALLPGSYLIGGCGSFPGFNAISANGNSFLPGGIPFQGTGPTATPARVIASRGRNLADMTRQALAGLGGMGTVVNPGDSVFIKANFLTAGLDRQNYTSTGEIAKPEIVVAVAEECLKAGAAKVIIGDGAQVFQFSWEELLTLDGSTNLAAEAARLNSQYGNRVQLACLNRDSPAWDPLPSRRTNLGQILASSLVTRSDKIISIPVLKTHHFAHVSLSLKNFMGVPPIETYGGGTEQVGRYRLHNAQGGPEGAFLDIAAALQPDLAIIDASIGCEGQGPFVHPTAGKTVDMRDRLGDWLILASTDLVAADVTAARIIGQEYTDIPYLVSAFEQGMGQARMDLITLVGANLDDLRVAWQPARVIL